MQSGFNRATQPPRFFLLFPNIWGFKGGIQVYSRILWQTLRALYPEVACDVFLKYDRQTDIATTPERTRFHCFGHLSRWQQSLGLAISVLMRGIRQRPTLAIATHLNYGIVLYWLEFLTGTPYWIVVHGLEGWNLNHPLRVKALQNAERAIAVSHHTRSRLLQEQHLSPERVTVLPNTFDAEQFQPAPKAAYLLQRYGLKPNQPIILTVTRLGKTAAYKGCDRVLQALLHVRQHIPDVHYLLVGKGDDTPHLRRLIQQLNLQDCVTLTGFVPEVELCDHYNLCDVFALPSTGEGFGIVYLEALACGKPVLAGDLDGSVDPLLHGQLGCLVNPLDVGAISTSLVQLLEGTHSNSLLFQPHQLRQEAIRHFELRHFRRCLADLILSSQNRQIRAVKHPSI